jgi:hypothetical protein
MFHAATEKVPRPPDEGGAKEADIVMIFDQLGNNESKTNGQIGSFWLPVRSLHAHADRRYP